MKIYHYLSKSICVMVFLYRYMHYERKQLLKNQYMRSVSNEGDAEHIGICKSTLTEDSFGKSIIYPVVWRESSIVNNGTLSPYNRIYHRFLSESENCKLSLSCKTKKEVCDNIFNVKHLFKLPRSILEKKGRV